MVSRNIAESVKDESNRLHTARTNSIQDGNWSYEKWRDAFDAMYYPFHHNIFDIAVV